MTNLITNFRLGMNYKEIEIDFLKFCRIQGKGSFGCGDEAQFLQKSTWGKVGDCLDAFKENEWLDLIGEKLRRERNFQGFSINR